MAVMTRKEMNEQMVQLRLPNWTYSELLDYILDGQFCGSFLEAILSNNLKESVNRCMQTEMDSISRFIIFLTNSAPAGCWGSEENYKTWRERKGLNGIMTTGKL